MPADLLRRRLLLLALAALGGLVPLCLGPRASLPPPSFFLHDQQQYLAMAQGRNAASAPFAWRILPSGIVRGSGLPAEAGFHALTLVTLALVPPLIAMLLSAAGVSAASAVMLGAIAAVSPPVAGYLAWDFIRPDGLSLLLIAICAWAVARRRPVIFASAMVALSLTKETWLIAASFALIWPGASAPGFRKWAIAGTLFALAASVAVRVAIPAAEPYSLVENFRELYLPLDPRTVARRVLLATAGTWNVLAPLAAFALARRLREPRAWAVAAALLIATAQMLVAVDTQRLVAAALPFVLLACGWELDRLPQPLRLRVGVGLALSQLPWLLAYARIWTPNLRAVEIILVLAALAAFASGLRTPERTTVSAA